MKNIVVLVAIAGLAAAGSSSSAAAIPTCGWSSTVITKAGRTETVPIPVASASCSASFSAASISQPTVPASIASTGSGPSATYTGPPIANSAALPTAAPMLLGALGLLAMI